MHQRFHRYIDGVDQDLQRLVTMSPVKMDALPRPMPKSGVYLLSEGSCRLYVGRSKRIRQRLTNHLSAPNKAPFAFRLAREATGNTDASYRPEKSRKALAVDPLFKDAFEKAKNRIAGMDVRFLEEPNPIRQALMEMYAAIVLETQYNDFDTH